MFAALALFQKYMQGQICFAYIYSSHYQVAAAHTVLPAYDHQISAACLHSATFHHRCQSLLHAHKALATRERKPDLCCLLTQRDLSSSLSIAAAACSQGACYSRMTTKFLLLAYTARPFIIVVNRCCMLTRRLLPVNENQISAACLHSATFHHHCQ